ncbi:FHA domain-containing protein [Candidatus Uabimicrobium sp. HlEnr_7]|uniref:FHA domain-containing protein n=1 Tax=Candidatus Uabimicrobium helgolandensis TaxID=3095367 RepID=UPI003556F5C7
MLQYKILIKCIKGVDQGREWRFTIKNDTVVIGRLRGCHLVVNDDKVSQSHCLIQVQNNDLSIIDMGSSFGTLVNENQLQGIQTLQNGDNVNLGDSTLNLKILSPDPQEKLKPRRFSQKNDEALVEEFLAPHNRISTDYQSNTSITNLDIIEETNLEISTSCIFCKNEEHTFPIGEYCVWNSCKNCKDFTHFIKVVLAENYQIIGYPIQIDFCGILVLAIDLSKQKKVYLYIYKQNYSQDNLLQQNVMSPTHFLKTDSYTYGEIPYTPGEFLTVKLFNDLSSLQKTKLIIQIAEAFEYSSQKWGVHKNITLNSIYIRVDGKPLIYGHGILPNKFTHDNLITRFQSPKMIEKKETTTRTDIWSFAAVLLFLQTGKYLYESTPNKKACVENFCGELQEGTPFWSFFASIFVKNNYCKWADVIDALKISVLLLH